MSKFPVIIPAGTEVKVKRSSGSVVIFTVGDDPKEYRLVVNADMVDKYLVANRSEIGLEKFSPAIKEQIAKGEIAVGMTKPEVYAARGCPAYTAWGKKADKKSFSEIMSSDTWYYMVTTRGHDVVAKFENGRVVSLDKY